MIATKEQPQKAKRMRGRARAELAAKPPTVVGPSSEKPPVLSPGVKLTRTYKGRRIVATCMEGGKFEWDGKFFTSLSALANEITGSHVSGNAWFGLTKPRAKKESPS